MCQISSPGASLISPKNLQIRDSPKSPPDPMHSRNLPRRPTSYIPTISPRLPSHTSQEFSLPSVPIPAIALEIFHLWPPNLRAPSPGMLHDVPWKIFQRDSLKWLGSSKLTWSPTSPPIHLPYTLPLHIHIPKVISLDPSTGPKNLSQRSLHVPQISPP